MHWLTVLFLVALAGMLATRLWLASRQIAAVSAHRDRVPEPFRDRIALADQQKAADYTVAMIGFAPGFPYLLGLPESLALPRLATPRTRVPAGSVAIGGNQTGIYPRESPGGWRLLGRTPLVLFDPARAIPSLLAPGDRVRFQRIDLAAFERMASP